ncbi:MAG: hypothetical protein QM813_09335 [Verrucomicrobiota bacterium]
MKKYLPSADEFVSGVLIVLGGLIAWSFLSPLVAKATAKLTPKAS